MPAGTESIASSVDRWLAQFERALGAGDNAGLRAPLPSPTAHWRDVLALTWGIRTVSGREAVIRELKPTPAGRGRRTSRPVAHRTPPREVTRAGTRAIEAIFGFDTAEGPRQRLSCDLVAPDGGTPKAWTCSRRSTELTGHEEQIGKRGRRASPIRAISAAPTGST